MVAFWWCHGKREFQECLREYISIFVWSAGAGRLLLVQRYSLSCARNRFFRHPSEYSADVLFSSIPLCFLAHHILLACFSRNRHLQRLSFCAVPRAWAWSATADSRCFEKDVTARPLHFPATISTYDPFLFFSIWLLEQVNERGIKRHSLPGTELLPGKSAYRKQLCWVGPRWEKAEKAEVFMEKRCWSATGRQYFYGQRARNSGWGLSVLASSWCECPTFSLPSLSFIYLYRVRVCWLYLES